MPLQTILAIDPGTTESAFCLLKVAPVIRGGVVIQDKGKLHNDGLRMAMDNFSDISSACVIEMIAHYGTGMPAGQEVFDTCVHIGRLMELYSPERCVLIPRMRVKLHLCGQPRAKDANIRQALIDRFGGTPCIKKGGALYKVTDDVWQALAVGLTYIDQYIHPRIG